jgi:hypothetical protein
MDKDRGLTVLDNAESIHIRLIVNEMSKTSWHIKNPIPLEDGEKIKQTMTRHNYDEIATIFLAGASKKAIKIFNESALIIKISGSLIPSSFYVGKGILCDENGKCLLLISLLFDNSRDHHENHYNAIEHTHEARDRFYIEAHPIIFDKAWRKTHPLERKIVVGFLDYLEIVRGSHGKPYEINVKEQINLFTVPVMPLPDEDNWEAFNLHLLNSIS